MKLFSRYNRLNLVMLVVVFVVSGALYYVSLKKIMIHEMDEELYKKRKQLSRYVERYGHVPSSSGLDEIILEFRPAEKILKKPKVSLIYRYDPEEQKMDEYRELRYSQQIDGRWYNVSVLKAVEGMSTLFRFITQTTLAIILFAVMASWLLNRFLLKKLWRPFYNTIAAIRAFKVTNAQEMQLPATDIDEFSFLNDNLSHAIRDARNEYRLLKEFTENASHEIQTPLAILRSKLDLLIQTENLSDRQIALMHAMYSPVKKLSRLNQSLLLLTKIENGQFNEQERVPLQPKVEEMIAQFSELWEAQRLKVTVDLLPATIMANTELLDILLNNLFSNATRHNIVGGELQVLLRPGSLTVRNAGEPQALAQELLFKRFIKDKKPSGGNGLGLAIIHQISKASGADIQYSFEDGLHGFTLIFAPLS
jgi:signal transduction histidine kinase